MDQTKNPSELYVLKKGYDLLLSPHPDDLLFSAFSALCDKRTSKMAIEYFNISKFSRWGPLPFFLVTPWRTLEEKLIMSLYKVNVRFLFLRDMTTERETGKSQKSFKISSLVKVIPGRIFCPLGVGGNGDHLLVRDSAIDFWRSCQKKPRLFFYEDLPYAAREVGEEFSITACSREVERAVSSLAIQCRPLSEEELGHKVQLCRTYVSQTNHGILLARHAKKMGRECSCEYAERFYLAE